MNDYLNKIINTAYNKAIKDKNSVWIDMLICIIASLTSSVFMFELSSVGKYASFADSLSVNLGYIHIMHFIAENFISGIQILCSIFVVVIWCRTFFVNILKGNTIKFTIFICMYWGISWMYLTFFANTDFTLISTSFDITVYNIVKAFAIYPLYALRECIYNFGISSFDSFYGARTIITLLLLAFILTSIIAVLIKKYLEERLHKTNDNN